MTMPVAERLKRWRGYEHARGWLGDAARAVIPKLEAELANRARLLDQEDE